MLSHIIAIFRYSLTYLLVVGVIASGINAVVHAVPNTVTMTPGSGTYIVGNTVEVTVTTSVDTLLPFEFAYNNNGAFTYDPNMMRLDSIDSSATGNYFGVSATSGSINFSSYKINGGGAFVAGTKLQMFTVRFTVLRPGTGSLNLRAGSIILNQSKAAQSVSYTINNPTPPPTPTPTPTPTPNPTPAPTPPPTPTPKPPVSTTRPAAPAPNIATTTGTNQSQPDASTTPAGETPETPTVSDTSPAPTGDRFSIGSVKTSTLYDGTNVAWRTTSDAASELRYGLSQDKYDNSIPVVKSEDGTYSANITKLQPGMKYFFMITARNSAGEQTEYKGAFSTKGYPVSITVQQNGQAVNSAVVSFDGLNGEYTTDESGKTSLNMKDGTYTLKIAKDTIAAEEHITVNARPFAAGGVPDTQTFTVQIASAASGLSMGFVAAIIGGILLLLSLVGLIIFAILKRRKQKENSYGYQSIIEDDWSTPPPEYAANYPGSTAFQPGYDAGATTEPIAYTVPTVAPADMAYAPSPATIENTPTPLNEEQPYVQMPSSEAEDAPTISYNPAVNYYEANYSATSPSSYSGLGETYNAELLTTPTTPETQQHEELPISPSLATDTATITDAPPSKRWTPSDESSTELRISHS
jgi:hypothetical protein